MAHEHKLAILFEEGRNAEGHRRQQRIGCNLATERQTAQKFQRRFQNYALRRIYNRSRTNPA
jgi:hypothetical protein